MNNVCSLPWPVRISLLTLVLWSAGSVAMAQSAEVAPVDLILYSPNANLEHNEVEMLQTAKVSVDVAMYSFTDREVAETLATLARRGVRVRVYRD